MLVEEYFNSQPENIEFIFYFNKKTSFIPSLSKFTKLKIINLSFNKLKTLPDIPNTVENINIQCNEFLFIPSLPLYLVSLNIHKNKINNIGYNVLPKTLIYFNCSNNLLVCLPEMSDNLQELICDNNLLTSLPKLSVNLEILSFQNNKIGKINDLPKNLIFFNSYENLDECQESFIKPEYWKPNINNKLKNKK